MSDFQQKILSVLKKGKGKKPHSDKTSIYHNQIQILGDAEILENYLVSLGYTFQQCVPLIDIALTLRGECIWLPISQCHQGQK